MRPLTTIRAIGLLGAGALLIAACNGSAATTAPTAAAPTPVPTTATVPTAVPGETMDLGSAFHGDQDLESVLPKTIGGVAITALSMTGDQFLGEGSTSPELSAALAALNKTPADLSVAFGASPTLTIVAFRV